jgi:Protein of unknown function (DUF3467)
MQKQDEEPSTPIEETVQEPTRQLPFKRASDFRVVYANSVRLGVSPWDFSFIFGQNIIDILDDLHVEDRISVTLSPQTAKAMAEILNRHIEEYEQQFGEIRYRPIQPSAGEPSA